MVKEENKMIVDLSKVMMMELLVEKQEEQEEEEVTFFLLVVKVLKMQFVLRIF